MKHKFCSLLFLVLPIFSAKYVNLRYLLDQITILLRDNTRKHQAVGIEK